MRCKGKRRHASLAEAIINLKRQPLKCLSPYHCPTCGGWHLGHRKKPKMRHFQAFIDRVLTNDRKKTP